MTRGAPRCPECMLVRSKCLCAEIPRLETDLELWIIRHVTEARKATNSARIAALAVPSCRILPYGVRGEVFDEAQLEGAAWLVFPPELDHSGEETGRHETLTGTAVRPAGPLVLLDGTWSQTRRMSHKIAALDRLPRYVLEPGPEPPRRVRKPPHPGAVSTLEAVARLIERFDDPEVAARLDALYLEWGRRARTPRPEEDGFR